MNAGERRELADARVERALLVLLLVVTLAVGVVAAWHARTFDPRPDAERVGVSIGTALVCDRSGCSER